MRDTKLKFSGYIGVTPKYIVARGIQFPVFTSGFIDKANFDGGKTGSNGLGNLTKSLKREFGHLTKKELF